MISGNMIHNVCTSLISLNIIFIFDLSVYYNCSTFYYIIFRYTTRANIHEREIPSFTSSFEISCSISLYLCFNIVNDYHNCIKLTCLHLSRTRHLDIDFSLMNQDFFLLGDLGYNSHTC